MSRLQAHGCRHWAYLVDDHVSGAKQEELIGCVAEKDVVLQGHSLPREFDAVVRALREGVPTDRRPVYSQHGVEERVDPQCYIVGQYKVVGLSAFDVLDQANTGSPARSRVGTWLEGAHWSAYVAEKVTHYGDSSATSCVLGDEHTNTASSQAKVLNHDVVRVH